MRYVVAIEKHPGQFEPHLFDSPEQFCAWYSAQGRPGVVVNRAAIRMMGGQVLPEVDHRTRIENPERTLPA